LRAAPDLGDHRHLDGQDGEEAGPAKSERNDLSPLHHNMFDFRLRQ